MLFRLLLLLCCVGCNRPGTIPKQSSVPATAAGNTAAIINYDSCKQAIGLMKQKLLTGWNRLPPGNREQCFTRAVTETIIPAWIGTPWSFNGTSEQPQTGSIACGYFVTTVLRDAGLPLARVKLAQCASEQMIRSLVQPRYIQRYSQTGKETFLEALNKNGYGLYLVGLDNHTGFLYHDGQEVYFIHSSVAGSRNVQKEKASESWVLLLSRYKVIGKLSADEQVLQRWFRNRPGA